MPASHGVHRSFQFGYSYRHVFFTVLPKARRIGRYSREFCIPALDGTTTATVKAAGTGSGPTGNLNASGGSDGASPACEGVQFIMGAFRRVDMPATVSFSYGVNDCEAALLTLPVATIDQMLEFGRRGNRSTAGRGVRTERLWSTL